jgi:hypothetical protein
VSNTGWSLVPYQMDLFYDLMIILMGHKTFAFLYPKDVKILKFDDRRQVMTKAHIAFWKLALFDSFRSSLTQKLLDIEEIHRHTTGRKTNTNYICMYLLNI